MGIIFPEKEGRTKPVGKKILEGISKGFFLLGTVYSLTPALLVLIFGPIQTKWFGIKIAINSLIEPWQTALVLFLLGWIAAQIGRWFFPEPSQPKSLQRASGEEPSSLPLSSKTFDPPKDSRLGKIRRKFPLSWDPLFLLAIVLFIGTFWGYGSHLCHYKSTAVNGCDTYAYLQGSVLMLNQGIWNTEMTDPLIPVILKNFQPPPKPEEVVFFLSPHGHYVYNLHQGVVYNVFPPGVSWLLWPFIHWGSLSPAFFVIPLLTLGAVLLSFLGSTRRTKPFFGIAFLSFTFFNFLVFQNAIRIMSDVPSMVFLALSHYLLFKNIEKENHLLVLGSGVFFGLAFTIRYTNLVGLVSLLLLFLIKGIRNKSINIFFYETILFGVAAVISGFLPMALYAHQHYGTFFALTYDPFTRSWMGWENLSTGAMFYLKSLYENFGLLELVIVILGFGVCLFNRKRRWVSLVGFTFFMAFFFFYAFQSLRHARYLLPVFPFLGLFYALGAHWIGGWFKRGKVAQAIVLLLLATYPSIEYVQKPFHYGDITEAEASHLLRSQVEDRAIIFCDDMTGPIKLYSGLTGYRFCWTEPHVFVETVSILKQLHRPLYFFLDNPPAKERFESWMNMGVLNKEQMEWKAEIQGMPLYRLN